MQFFQTNTFDDSTSVNFETLYKILFMTTQSFTDRTFVLPNQIQPRYIIMQRNKGDNNYMEFQEVYLLGFY